MNNPKITQILSDIKQLVRLTEDIISDSENESITEKAISQQDILDQLIVACNELEDELNGRSE